MSCCTTKTCPDSSCQPEHDYGYEPIKIVVWAVGDITAPVQCHYGGMTVTVTANATAQADSNITLLVSVDGPCGNNTFEQVFPGVYVNGNQYVLNIGCQDTLGTYTITSSQGDVSSPSFYFSCRPELICDPDVSMVVSCLINNGNVDRLILLGNSVATSYALSVGSWYSKLKQGNSIYPILGNQDWDLDGGGEYFSYFNVPSYYKKTIGNTDFFMLDSGWNSMYDLVEPDGNTEGTLTLKEPTCCGLGYERSGGSVQWQWFVDQVMASTAKFKVVCIHHPPWSSNNVEWGRSPEISKWGSHVTLQWEAFKLLGIDLVLSSHDIDYERLEVDGVKYVICGLGGSNTGSPGDPPSGAFGDPSLSTSVRRYNAQYGALQLTITNEHLYGRFITVDGRIRDEFTL